MANQNLLIIFVALATLAILIQTGIATGLLFASLKMSRQADKALAEARRLFAPAQKVVDALETASLRFSEFSTSSQASLHETGSRWEQTLREFRKRIS